MTENPTMTNSLKNALVLWALAIALIIGHTVRYEDDSVSVYSVLAQSGYCAGAICGGSEVYQP